MSAKAEEDLIEPAVQRQRDRLALIPAVYKTSIERMACELALQTAPAADIFSAYGFNAEQSLDLLEQKSFQDLLAKVEAELRGSAHTIRLKARAMVEDLLPEAYSIGTDPLIHAAVRLDVMQWLGRLADVEPRKDSQEKGTGGGLVLNITFAGQGQQVVAHEPLTIDSAP
jgi:hypothetical protein